MDAKVKQQWLTALRSNEYTQAVGNLRTEQGYCCLGVLCDLYAKEHNSVGWDVVGDVDYEFLNEIQTLPKKVKIWAGLSHADPYYVIADEETKETNIYLSRLNDQGYTFEEIAQLIEEQL